MQLVNFSIAGNAGTNATTSYPLTVQNPAEVIVVAQLQMNHNFSCLWDKTSKLFKFEKFLINEIPDS